MNMNVMFSLTKTFLDLIWNMKWWCKSIFFLFIRHGYEFSPCCNHFKTAKTHHHPTAVPTPAVQPPHTYTQQFKYLVKPELSCTCDSLCLASCQCFMGCAPSLAAVRVCVTADLWCGTWRRLITFDLQTSSQLSRWRLIGITAPAGDLAASHHNVTCKDKSRTWLLVDY